MVGKKPQKGPMGTARSHGVTDLWLRLQRRSSDPRSITAGYPYRPLQSHERNWGGLGGGGNVAGMWVAMAGTELRQEFKIPQPQRDTYILTLNPQILSFQDRVLPL